MKNTNPSPTSLVSRLCGSFLLSLIAVASALAAGELDPPGPPARMMRTLDQINPCRLISALPYTISEPGAYLVETNLTGIANNNGITIAANCVTLDLGGFELAGVLNSREGIYVPGGHTNICIRNGSVRNWGRAGVEAVFARSSMLLDLRASANGSSGLRLGHNSLVRQCASHDNGSDGIYVGENTSVEDCTAEGNARVGISTLAGASIKDCEVSNSGAEGIQVGDGSSVKDCVSRNNGSDGIETTYGCTVSGCTARGNATLGIELGPGSTATSCAADQNDGHGFRGFDGSQVLRCTASRNGTNGIMIMRPMTLGTGSAALVVECTAEANRSDGINIGSSGIVRSCLARNNGEDGIDVLSRSSVLDSVSCSNVVVGIRASESSGIRGCTATQNRSEGILVSNSCVVAENVCEANNYGIRATGTGNRIEENHTANNTTRGFKIDAQFGFNVIVKNTARNRLGRATNYNYEVAAGNIFGPVIEATTGTGGTLANVYPQNHAWANFGDPESIE